MKATLLAIAASRSGSIVFMKEGGEDQRRGDPAGDHEPHSAPPAAGRLPTAENRRTARSANQRPPGERHARLVVLAGNAGCHGVLDGRTALAAALTRGLPAKAGRAARAGQGERG